MAKDLAWHRRQALMLASQLPENAEDGLIILQLATQIAADFLSVDEPEKKSAPVIALIGGGNDSA